VLAALVADGPYAALYSVPFPGTFRADHIIRLCEQLPPVPVPTTVVVLDNASIDISHLVRAARPALRTRRTFLYYLPPYSPELNDIERHFRTIKYDDLPERRYPTIPLLDAAVRQAFTAAEERLMAKHAPSVQPQQQPRRAAYHNTALLTCPPQSDGGLSLRNDVLISRVLRALIVQSTALLEACIITLYLDRSKSQSSSRGPNRQSETSPYNICDIMRNSFGCAVRIL
jgi:hypothetical protein